VKLKRAIVVMAILTVLVAGFCVPRPARASSSNTALYVCIGLGAYLVIVFTAAYMVYGEAEQGLPPVSLDGVPPVSESSSIHFAQGCAQRGTSVTLLCW
jgi:hypothetical protein